MTFILINTAILVISGILLREIHKTHKEWEEDRRLDKLSREKLEQQIKNLQREG